MSAPVRRGDCEVARTAEELITWIESVEDQFHADDRIEGRLIKAFFEEIRPLGDLAQHKYLGRPGLYLRPKIGDQDYDAEIIDRSSGDEHVTPVEFTSVYRDKYLALRVEYLPQHGVVPMNGPVWRDGTKASGGQIHAEPHWGDDQSRFEHLEATCEKRMAQKLCKPYPPGTIIAIVFDDTVPKQAMPQIKLYFRDTLSKQALDKFRGLFVLGASGRTFWEFGETDFPRSG